MELSIRVGLVTVDRYSRVTKESEPSLYLGYYFGLCYNGFSVIGSGRVFFESGRVMDFAHPYLFSFMDHLCQYLDYGPLFASSNFNTNRETQTPPSPFEVYYKLHYNAKKGWLNDEAKSEYENIIHHKEEAVAKLISEGTTITTTTDHELEKEAIESVCAKEKTTKSAWKVGVGPVFRKKDFWMTSEAGSSQPSSREAEALRNKVALLEEKLKQSNEKSEKVLMFMSSKFPDFESSISAHMRGGANDLDGQLNDNDSLI
ncbi:hypothetical protein HanXRQr2_Chr10g0431711 [Helianthus annuus]|uniref:Uncharacterized protein n=1 Tax=Helianthus annuus TaxID=4232 RepID=A0A251TIG1_HELAN|nr:hypothetical protein HanXRQr2_Chr10g0431711 [Helianthus annuus]KAJ0520988.1 hypothetical protein HanIR_Chr10g0465641 [Helianthus annuus]